MERDADMDGHSHDYNDTDKTEILPSEWLQEICIGSLTNAGCNILHLSNYLQRRSLSSSSSSPRQYNDARHSLTDYEYDDHDYYDDDNETEIDPTTQDNDDHYSIFRDYKEEEELLQKRILSTTPGTGGIDFDLLVPALLILQRRGESDGDDHPWRTIITTAGGMASTRTNITAPTIDIAQSSTSTDNTITTTQSILNAACHLAGRQTIEESYFAFDAGMVMRQCAMLENVLAASYLIGGHDGLVLRCAHILLCKEEEEEGRGDGIVIGSVDEAEHFLLHSGGCGGVGVVSSTIRPAQAQDRYDGDGGAITTHNDGDDADADNDDNLGDDFILTEGHRQLLWLLERYVLSVSKYGQFTTTVHQDQDIRRGAAGIDPVFCAQICLRAWIWLSSTTTTTMSTTNNSGRWLADWLGKRLIGTGNDIHLMLNTTTTTMTCPPKKRLVCAALTRALLWNDDDDDDNDNDYEDDSNKTNNNKPVPATRPRQRQKRRQKRQERQPMVLAESLGFDTRFIVFLAEASCGLVECIPSPIADAMMRTDNKGGMMTIKSTSSTTLSF